MFPQTDPASAAETQVGVIHLLESLAEVFFAFFVLVGFTATPQPPLRSELVGVGPEYGGVSVECEGGEGEDEGVVAGDEGVFRFSGI